MITDLSFFKLKTSWSAECHGRKKNIEKYLQ